MKKIIAILSIAVALLLCSCAKDPIGGTNVQNVSGEWFVESYLVNAAGEEIDTYLDYHIHAKTFNTNANDSDKMYILVEDDGEIDFSFGNGFTLDDNLLVNVNQETKTFSADNVFYYDYDEETPVFANVSGSIVPNGTKTKSGAVADKFECTIALCDKDGNNILKDVWEQKEYPSYYEGEVAVAVKLVGWRYTGLAADEDVVSPVSF